ncbi:MAG: alpha amylase C-terminal domain-containing protein [Candidatus Krumholzibacteria bacterium]|nr:alpha amylase C-terminal domain-containing protein [Candidatus Krumholzibacteria bacterium]
MREYFLGSALHWLEEYRIDGFRMDATAYMTLQAGGWSLMQEMNDLIDRRFAGAIVIAEQLPDDDWVTRPTSLGGAGFDAQYFDWFTDTIREEIFDAALGDPEMGRIRDIIYGAGEYLGGARAVNYFELHDEAWPSSGGQRAVRTIDTTFPHDDLYARGRTKLAQGIVALAPGIPAVLMGTEWLEDADFGTDLANRNDWAKKTNYDEIFAYYVDLFELRIEPAFRAGASRDVRHLNEGGNVIGFRRWSGESDFVIVASFSNSDYPSYRIGVPREVFWREVLNSEDPLYGGDGPVNGGTLVPEAFAYDGYSHSLVIGLPAMGLVVLQAGSEQTGDEEDAAPPRAGALDPNLPTPFHPSTTIRFTLPAAGPVALRVYDLSGRLVRTLLDGPLPAGRHEVRWDATNDHGATAASGVYFCRLTAPGSETTRRMVLLRRREGRGCAEFSPPARKTGSHGAGSVVSVPENAATPSIRSNRERRKA